MFTRGLQRKYVYPSLFFLLLLLVMLLRMAVASAEEAGAAALPAVDAWQTGLTATSNSVRPHSEADFINAVNEFNAALNPRTEKDRETQDVILLAGKEDRVKELQRNWRRANGSFFVEDLGSYGHTDRNYQATYGDRQYSTARNQLDNRRFNDLHSYRQERRDVEKKMVGLNRHSDEYESLAGQLQELDLRYIDRESGYRKEYHHLDISFSLRSH